MNKLFIPIKANKNDSFIVDGEDAKHLIKSLRFKVGDKVSVSNMEESIYDCEVSAIDKNQLELTVMNVKPATIINPLKIVLFQCLPKSNKLELIIQKAVEVGVDCIVPTDSLNCVVKLNDNKAIDGKVQRWNKISLEAAKQCGRDDVPVVDEPVSFKEAVSRIKEMDLGILPYENERSHSIRDLLTYYSDKVQDTISKKGFCTVGIIVGSEGGFDESEVKFAEENGLLICTLGKRILRCETAAIVTTSIVNYVLGDLN